MRVVSKFFIFCFVGGISFLIDLSFLNLLYYFGWPFIAARTTSISLALIFNFFANHAITFHATHHQIRQQIIPYIIVYVVSNVVNLLSSALIIWLAQENVLVINVASLIGTFLSIPVSFLGSFYFTFKK